MDDLRSILLIFRRNWWMILLTPILAVLIVLAIDSRAPARYRSSARLFVSTDPSLLEGRDLIYSYSSLDKASIVATFVEIANSRRIFVDAVSALSLPPELSQQYVLKSVILPSTSVLEVSVDGPDPETVQALANAAGLKTIEFIRTHYEGYSLEFLDPPYLPVTPYQPSPQKDAAIAGVLGLVVGLLLASVREVIERPLDPSQQKAAQDPASTALKRSYLLKVLDNYSDPRNGFVTLALIRLDGLENLRRNLPTSAYRRLIRGVTNLLRSELRGKDLVARWNDNSFAILMPNTTSADASRLLERVQYELAQPVSIFDNDEMVQVQPRIGATQYRGSEISPQAMVQAEKALERAAANSYRPVFYTPETYEDQTMPVKV
jgi:diguanylate cyclase (GGDEF)-like protein